MRGNRKYQLVLFCSRVNHGKEHHNERKNLFGFKVTIVDPEPTVPTVSSEGTSTCAAMVCIKLTIERVRTAIHRFQKLSEDLVTLNEHICRLRPVEQQRGGWTELKKNDCCDPSGGGAGSKPAALSCLCATP
jgi:hypothetical protein